MVSQRTGAKFSMRPVYHPLQCRIYIVHHFFVLKHLSLAYSNAWAVGTSQSTINQHWLLQINAISPWSRGQCSKLVRYIQGILNQSRACYVYSFHQMKQLVVLAEIVPWFSLSRQRSDPSVNSHFDFFLDCWLQLSRSKQRNTFCHDTKSF